jgi:hypothetical protein
MEPPSLDAASYDRPAGNFGSYVGPFRSALVNVGRVIAKLSKFRIMFTLSSSLYCLTHWLMVTHSFSIYVLSSALVFGAIAATAVSWLSDRFSSSPT